MTINLGHSWLLPPFARAKFLKSYKELLLHYSNVQIIQKRVDNKLDVGCPMYEIRCLAVQLMKIRERANATRATVKRPVTVISMKKTQKISKRSTGARESRSERVLLGRPENRERQDTRIYKKPTRPQRSYQFPLKES